MHLLLDWLILAPMGNRLLGNEDTRHAKHKPGILHQIRKVRFCGVRRKDTQVYPFSPTKLSMMASAGSAIGVTFLENSNLFKTECTNLPNKNDNTLTELHLWSLSAAVAEVECSRMHRPLPNVSVFTLYKMPRKTIHGHPKTYERQQFQFYTEHLSKTTQFFKSNKKSCQNG